MQGKFIVIDGLDGSGKGTQTELLVKRLKEEGYNVEMADFPQYGQPSAHFVERYLRGEFGSASEVTARQASLFYALDRFSAKKQMQQWLNEGKIIISNRYVSASKGHQLGKVADDERLPFLQWLTQLEYGTLGIPKPDLTIFLHMKPEIGQKLVDQKAAREYTQGKKRDIHEADLNHLQDTEKAFLFCMDNDGEENWYKITCFEHGQPRSREEIHAEIYKKIKEVL
jgi:dTMP kinase